MKRCIPLLFLLAACAAGGPQLPRFPLVLDTGPALVAVQVADAQEAGLLAQALGAEPQLAARDQLYFDAQLAERLRGLGYEPQQVDAGQVRRAVVRLYTDEGRLRGSGVLLLRRDADYLLVEGTLNEIEALHAAGIPVAAPDDDEPRPMEVRVTMPAEADVQQVNVIGVDIYHAEPAASGWVLTGGAYEWHIDAMTAAGYTVERINTVPPSEE